MRYIGTATPMALRPPTPDHGLGAPPDAHGQPIERVREIRDEIARRISELITDF
jgi:hypothetical protein